MQTSLPTTRTTARSRIRPARAFAAGRLFAAALVAGMAVSLPLALAAAGPATAASRTARPAASPTPTPLPTPTPSHFVSGRRVYDFDGALTASEQSAAESMAADLEKRGSGRVVIYTAETRSDLPDTNALVSDWQIDGLLLIGAPPFDSSLIIGSKLNALLNSEQRAAFDASPGSLAFDSWALSSLARADGLVAGTRVWDGAAALDDASKALAEASVESLSAGLGSPVYVEISVGGDDPAATAYFNAAHLSGALQKSGALIVELSVSGTRIAGNIETGNPNLVGKYTAAAPWASTTLSVQAASAGDVPAQLLAAIRAVGGVSSGPASTGGSGGGGGPGAEIVLLIVVAVALIALGVGFPFYRPWLMSAAGGVRAFAAPAAPAAPVAAPPPAGSAAPPPPGEVASLVDAVQAGTLPTVKGSADRLLATGTRGTAFVTSVEPLGKYVRDVDPSAPEDRLDDPVWLFTVEVSVSGRQPFPAVFGHRVPRARIATVAPGARLLVAVDMTNPSSDVAIDWDRTPAGNV